MVSAASWRRRIARAATPPTTAATAPTPSRPDTAVASPNASPGTAQSTPVATISFAGPRHPGP